MFLFVLENKKIFQKKKMKKLKVVILFLCFFFSTLYAEQLETKTPLQQNIKVPGKMHSGFLERSNQVTTTTRKSWGDKFEDAFYMCILGCILFICSFPSLWFNERRAVRTSELISKGFKICHELNSNEINPQNNGNLVYLSGKAVNNEALKDEVLGITVEKSLKLKRVVEMFQWKERCDTRTEKDWFGGGETTKKTYTYEKIWSDELIDSGVFHDQSKSNPYLEKWIARNETFLSKTSQIGNFELADHQLEQLKCFQTLHLEENHKNHFSELFTEKVNGITTMDRVSVDNNFIYIRSKGEHIDNQIGDLRFSYVFVPEEHLSLVSCQTNNTFIPYDIKRKGFRSQEESQVLLDKGNQPEQMDINFDDEDQDSCCVKCCPCCICCLCYGAIGKLCKTPTIINWIYEKAMTKQELFDEKEKENRCMTWIIRLVGFLMMVFGIYLFFSPVYELLEILPLLSSVGKLVVLVFAILVCIPICSLIIILAWMFYRPLIALLFLGITIVFSVALYLILSKSQQSQQMKF